MSSLRELMEFLGLGTKPQLSQAARSLIDASARDGWRFDFGYWDSKWKAFYHDRFVDLALTFDRYRGAVLVDGVDIFTPAEHREVYRAFLTNLRERVKCMEPYEYRQAADVEARQNSVKDAIASLSAVTSRD